MRGRQSHAAKPIQFRLYTCRSQLRTKKSAIPCKSCFQHVCLKLLSLSDPSRDTLFLHSFWHTIWKYTNYIWHIISILSFYLTFCPAYTLTFYLASFQAFILAFYLASIPTFHLMSGIPSDILFDAYSDILFGILSGMCSGPGVLFGSRGAPQHLELAIWCSGPACIAWGARRYGVQRSPSAARRREWWQRAKEGGRKGKERKRNIRIQRPSPGSVGKKEVELVENLINILHKTRISIKGQRCKDFKMCLPPQRKSHFSMKQVYTIYPNKLIEHEHDRAHQEGAEVRANAPIYPTLCSYVLLLRLPLAFTIEETRHFINGQLIEVIEAGPVAFVQEWSRTTAYVHVHRRIYIYIIYIIYIHVCVRVWYRRCLCMHVCFEASVTVSM